MKQKSRSGTMPLAQGHAPNVADQPDRTVKELPEVSPFDEPLTDRMRLGDVVIWIATRGEKLTSRQVADRIDDAEAELIRRLDCAEIAAEGTREGRDPADIPRRLWASLRVDREAGGTPTPGRPYLSWVPDAGGESTYLETRRGKKWTAIRFKKEDVRRLWPFGNEALTAGRKAANDYVKWLPDFFDTFIREKNKFPTGRECHRAGIDAGIIGVPKRDTVEADRNALMKPWQDANPGYELIGVTGPKPPPASLKKPV